ncbi:MAG: hypothetical protein GYA17_22275 [Chloroflexi bacterium]|nr:hypothetical protein [Chloroflexota bacterium]
MTIEKKIDINQASSQELSQVPGIGAQLAERIVAGRPYQTLLELQNISGIGQRLYEQILPYVEIGGSEAAAPTEEPEPGPAGEDSLAATALRLETLQETPAEEQSRTTETVAAAGPEVEGQAAEAAPWQEEESAPGIPIPEADAPAMGAPPTAQPAADKKDSDRPRRSEMIIYSLVFSLLALVGAVVITLATLGVINGGISYATSRQYYLLQQRLDVLDQQSDRLAQNLEVMQNRLDNVQALSSRVGGLEDEAVHLRSDLEDVAQQFDELQTSIGQLNQQVESMATRTSLFERFLQGLQGLLNDSGLPAQPEG